MAKDEGTAEMRAVSTPIREGAEGFLRVQVRRMDGRSRWFNSKNNQTIAGSGRPQPTEHE
jgi:hypothetical protein